MLIQEAHLTNKHYIKIPKFKIYCSKHSTGYKGHAGNATMIRENIKHYEIEKYEQSQA